MLGYQKHIKNFTIHYLLKNLIEPKDGNPIENGSLDYCLATILPLINEEIFGGIQEEKEVEEIKKKTPEFKSSKAFDCYQILASIIDFKKTVINKIVLIMKLFIILGCLFC